MKWLSVGTEIGAGPYAKAPSLEILAEGGRAGIKGAEQLAAYLPNAKIATAALDLAWVYLNKAEAIRTERFGLADALAGVQSQAAESLSQKRDFVNKLRPELTDPLSPTTRKKVALVLLQSVDTMRLFDKLSREPSTFGDDYIAAMKELLREALSSAWKYAGKPIVSGLAPVLIPIAILGAGYLFIQSQRNA